jgi:hypothetical protein
MREASRWGSVGTLFLAGLVLSSCGVEVTSSSVSLAPESVHGAVGGRFKISFPTRVFEKTYHGTGKRQPQYGVGVLASLDYTSGTGNPPTVNVSVETLTNVVPPRRARAFLRSYLPTTHGGRIITWQGHQAAIAVVPGCNPSGQCVGDVGTLVVLNGLRLFSIWTSEASVGTANSELQTFRLVRT